MAACHMNDLLNEHQPVMLKEVMAHLNIKPSGIYVDATFGRGGHAQAILQGLNETGRLLVLDKDPDAIAYAYQHFANDKRVIIQQSSFSNLTSLLTSAQCLGQVDGILLDLGVSSPQLTNPKRGFSFMHNGPLDMRMNPHEGVSASDWLSNIAEKELANVFWQYGEERYARRIARAIILARKEKEITTTDTLRDIIAKAHPAWQRGKHPATKCFQAIRIVINKELEELKQGLVQSVTALKIGGRLLVISFHSIEDRIVKQFIQNEAQGSYLPADFPVKAANIRRIKRITRAIKPSSEEIKLNVRARSAILRIGEKIV